MQPVGLVTSLHPYCLLPPSLPLTHQPRTSSCPKTYMYPRLLSVLYSTVISMQQGTGTGLTNPSVRNGSLGRLPKHCLRDFHVHLPPSRRSAMAVAASDMIPEMPSWPASSTRSSTLQDCWLEPRPHLVHLHCCRQASTSGFARLPLSYAWNGADRLPRIMQVRQCTVALVAFYYWTRLCATVATAWLWRQSDAHLENAAG
jgi:hypothetical protein